MRSAVIDANLAIYAIIPSSKHEQALNLLETLAERNIPVYVPQLWVSEVTTGIRKSMVMGSVSTETALLALQAVLALPIEKVSEDPDLCIQAYHWAERLGQLAVYDAMYLALAERMQADFYTADQRLFNRCQQLGAEFVKWVS
ncbi:type II toxin-antitoxin system VapC family toxin [Anaerolinea thermophila]|uniref:PIN domain-containing protein n=1 Tax=Anaerolinea thermophila (strain DSM 14523 / JCM 11388 / NBRC 100420 / UNI-1) TaxID=926569 RepID=E8MY32_ANATU|nr:type II toxin-antitoxin system VapC family toxin [Anaerolinea thermophila]BAJ64263.1 hypothetical protein ANT_22370 [Anaerolinea thermophila UNI-1]